MTRQSRDFKDNPKKVADAIYADKGYKMSPESFTAALPRGEVDLGFPGDLKPYMQQ